MTVLSIDHIECILNSLIDYGEKGIMKVLILAGGFGTRLSEETESRPKPMVLIDDKPILWHLMKIFDLQGFSDFILALGYKGEYIKRWVLDLYELSGDFEIDSRKQILERLKPSTPNKWKVSAIDTGLQTQTGGRIKQCMEKFPNQRLIVTYGDGLANIKIDKLIDFHLNHGKLATVTSVRPPARFGQITSENGLVLSFNEKNQADAGWINGGFFILEPDVAKFISSNEEAFETGALVRLVKEKQLMTYQHNGFWQPMDTLRDKIELTKLASLQNPPWLENI